jgi:hypothetical protein
MSSADFPPNRRRRESRLSKQLFMPAMVDVFCLWSRQAASKHRHIFLAE